MYRGGKITSAAGLFFNSPAALVYVEGRTLKPGEQGHKPDNVNNAAEKCK